MRTAPRLRSTRVSTALFAFTSAAALASLDRSLQAGGYLVPLFSLERRMAVARAFCNLRPDPVGTLDWASLGLSRSRGGDCGER